MQRARSWLGALRSQDRPPRKIKYYGPEEHRPALRYDRAPRYDLYTLDTLFETLCSFFPQQKEVFELIKKSGQFDDAMVVPRFMEEIVYMIYTGNYGHQFLRPQDDTAYWLSIQRKLERALRSTDLLHLGQQTYKFSTRNKESGPMDRLRYAKSNLFSWMRSRNFAGSDPSLGYFSNSPDSTDQTASVDGISPSRKPVEIDLMSIPKDLPLASKRGKFDKPQQQRVVKTVAKTVGKEYLPRDNKFDKEYLPRDNKFDREYLPRDNKYKRSHTNQNVATLEPNDPSVYDVTNNRIAQGGESSVLKGSVNHVITARSHKSNHSQPTNSEQYKNYIKEQTFPSCNDRERLRTYYQTRNPVDLQHTSNSTLMRGQSLGAPIGALHHYEHQPNNAIRMQVDANKSVAQPRKVNEPVATETTTGGLTITVFGRRHEAYLANTSPCVPLGGAEQVDSLVVA